MSPGFVLLQAVFFHRKGARIPRLSASELSMRIPVPANGPEYFRAFGTDGACLDALVKARWPHGFVCPVCATDKGWRLQGRPLVEGSGCGHQVSATAGTLFHCRKSPLSLIFRIIYMVVVQKSGISIDGVSRDTGVNCKTAELWMRKIRQMTASDEREKLSGTVEVDETIIHGAGGSPGRSHADNRCYAVIIAEDRGAEGLGRIRIEASDYASSQSLHEAISKNVEAGSTLRTDGWVGYRPMARLGYQHEPENTIDPKTASQKFPLVYRVASLLKRVISSTFQGSWSPTLIQTVLDKFVFRFNRRKARERPLLAARIIEEGLARRPWTRRETHEFAKYAT